MEVTWYDETHLPGLVATVQAVAAAGGAIGWLTAPPADEVQAWVTGLLAGGSRLAVAVDGGRVVGCGALTRKTAPVVAGMAVVSKVMTHPDARGSGAGRAVVRVLVDTARHDGVEVLTLGCRGNNHGAQRLYAELGFVVTGRVPDALAVGEERFDEVLMHLDLRRGTHGLVRHGSRHEGPGAT